MADKLDLIIVGAGPAGMMASVYASRYMLKNMVIGKQLGGELSLAHKVCNFPGFIEISGLELAEKLKNQVESLGAKVLLKEAVKIGKTADGFCVKINENEIYEAKAVIVATGSERRRLDILGEREYLGKGISYCHSCDGPLYKGKTVCVIGGSDSAVSGAVHLADYAAKIYLIYRGEALRAEPLWIREWQNLVNSGKGVTIYKTNLKEVVGDGKKTTGVKLDNPYQGSEILNLDGVFVEIGSVPGITLVEELGVTIDESGHVKVDDQMATNIPGLFCAGDMVSKSAEFKQATWAVGHGAMAAASAYKYLKQEAAPQIRGK